MSFPSHISIYTLPSIINDCSPEQIIGPYSSLHEVTSWLVCLMNSCVDWNLKKNIKICWLTGSYSDLCDFDKGEWKWHQYANQVWRQSRQSLCSPWCCPVLNCLALWWLFSAESLLLNDSVCLMSVKCLLMPLLWIGKKWHHQL